MEELRKPSVHMKNPDHVEEVMSHFVKGGRSKLQIVSDFDNTLSRKYKNGIVCQTSFGLLKNGPHVSDENKKKVKELFDYYYPIEHDTQLSDKEKEPYMIEWYEKSMKIVMDLKVKKEHIERAVQLSGGILRKGCDVFIKSLHSNDVPLLVLSAGNGDVIKEVMKQEGLLYPNVKIMSNFLDFDEQGIAIGLKGELIHSLNKSVGTEEKRNYFDHLQSRNNVLLLGDIISDCEMAEGVPDLNQMLKIGFLNTKVQENLPAFLEAFDIVIAEDQTMDLPNSLLQRIL